MDMENNIKEEVYKCSKCGLCKSVCPIFLANKNEMFLPRGRFVILNGVFNLKNKMSPKFIKDLDICLNCNACKNFCPSSIDSYKIFTFIKNEYNYKYSVFNFSFLYRLLLLSLSFGKFLYKIFPFKSLFLNTYIDNLYSNYSVRGKYEKSKLIKGNVIFFEGCFNKYINDSDKTASLNLIEKCGYNVTQIIDKCCGYPYLNEGNFNKFIKNANKILSYFDKNADYIVCSCDSCFDTLKKLSNFTENASVFTKKLIRLDDFLKMNNIKVVEKNNVQYFKPLLRDDDCYLLSDVKLLNKKGSVSLMENFFILKYKKMSKQMINSVFFKPEQLADKTVVTTCSLSKWGLMKGFSIIKSRSRVLSYAEYIDNIALLDK